MRRLSKFLLIILTAVLFLPACDGGIGVEREILGTWESEGSLFEPSRTAVFTHDKVLILTNYFGEEERMHYAIIAPGKMRIGDDESEQIISFRLEGDLLELELDGDLLSLERVAPEVSAYQVDAAPTTVSARKEGPISPPEATGWQLTWQFSRRPAACSSNSSCYRPLHYTHTPGILSAQELRLIPVARR